MKNKKGFTLIELLAILVILAIISLIAIPVVLNIIDKVRVSSYERSADNILDASRIYFKETQIDSTMSIEGNNYDKVMESISGRKPDSGEIYIKKNGEIALTLKYDKYCFQKDYSNNKITKLEECELDENDPIITANSTSETVCNPISNKITSYFTIDSNGISGIERTTCESDKDGMIENIEDLSSNKHKVTCTVIKRNGKSSSASIDIQIGPNKVGEKNIGGVTYANPLPYTETIKTEEKSKTWIGKIGLNSLSEYVQAVSPSQKDYKKCMDNIYYTGYCNNWMPNGWTITPRASNSSSVWVNGGIISGTNPTMFAKKGTVPTIYLKSDITLSGNGIRGDNAFTIVES